VAGRTVSTLQCILGHAARLDRIEAHPSKGARKLAGKKKTRRLSVPEIEKLGQAMRHAARNETESSIALAIVRLLLLSGFRISEGHGLERAWVSPEGAMWTSRHKGERTGEGHRPVCREK
jgi:integrase